MPMDARFGNIEEIAIPPTMFDPRFERLLQTALDRGREITRDELDGIFPDIPWEY